MHEMGDQLWGPSTNKLIVSRNATFFEFYFEPKLAQVVQPCVSSTFHKTEIGDKDGAFDFTDFMADPYCPLTPPPPPPPIIQVIDDDSDDGDSDVGELPGIISDNNSGF